MPVPYEPVPQWWIEWNIEDLEELLKLVKEVVTDSKMFGQEFLRDYVLPDVKETTNTLIESLTDLAERRIRHGK
jgi:hypothetical protein